MLALRTIRILAAKMLSPSAIHSSGWVRRPLRPHLRWGAAGVLLRLDRLSQGLCRSNEAWYLLLKVGRVLHEGLHLLGLRQRQECAPTVRGSAIDLCETLIQEIQRLLRSLAIGYLDPTDKFITAGAENSQPVARKSSDYAGVAHYLVPAANCL
jgi:hypothetical protein